MKRRILAFGFAAVGIAIVVRVLSFWSSVRAFEAQINNLETFKTYWSCLKAYHDRVGSYPDRLEEVRGSFHHSQVQFGTDWWGNPVKYESRGDGFILVGFGRDGIPDGLDPWRLRELKDPDRNACNTCGNSNTDQIMSDLGFHRACFK